MICRLLSILSYFFHRWLTCLAVRLSCHLQRLFYSLGNVCTIYKSFVCTVSLKAVSNICFNIAVLDISWNGPFQFTSDLLPGVQYKRRVQNDRYTMRFAGTCGVFIWNAEADSAHPVHCYLCESITIFATGYIHTSTHAWAYPCPDFRGPNPFHPHNGVNAGKFP